MDLAVGDFYKIHPIDKLMTPTMINYFKLKFHHVKPAARKMSTNVDAQGTASENITGKLYHSRLAAHDPRDRILKHHVVSEKLCESPFVSASKCLKIAM